MPLPTPPLLDADINFDVDHMPLSSIRMPPIDADIDVTRAIIYLLLSRLIRHASYYISSLIMLMPLRFVISQLLSCHQ